MLSKTVLSDNYTSKRMTTHHEKEVQYVRPGLNVRVGKEVLFRNELVNSGFLRCILFTVKNKNFLFQYFLFPTFLFIFRPNTHRHIKDNLSYPLESSSICLL